MSDPELVAAVRFTAWTLMAAKTLLVVNVRCRVDFSRPLREQIPWFERYLPTMVDGLWLGGLGLTLHQVYWWLAEIAKADGKADIVALFVNASLVTSAFYLMMYVGVVMLFSGWLSQYVGSLWPIVGGAVVLFLLFVGGVSA